MTVSITKLSDSLCACVHWKYLWLLLVTTFLNNRQHAVYQWQETGSTKMFAEINGI